MLGPDSEFFDVGGDSLAAVEIVTRLGDLFGHQVAIGTLLAAPTPRRLAATLDVDVAATSPAGDEFQLVPLRPGTPDGPVIIMTAAWDDVFGYQALAESFDDATTVLALVYQEQPDRPLITTVDALVGSALPIVRGAVRGRRRVAVVGWSVGGVVAVELADRLGSEGCRVDLVAAIDTFFPGEHRHLWSNRWWKYKSMLRPGSFGAAASELRTMAGRRVRRLAGKLGRRLMTWSGAVLPVEPPRHVGRRLPRRCARPSVDRGPDTDGVLFRNDDEPAAHRPTLGAGRRPARRRVGRRPPSWARLDHGRRTRRQDQRRPLGAAHRLTG